MAAEAGVVAVGDHVLLRLARRPRRGRRARARRRVGRARASGPGRGAGRDRAAGRRRRRRGCWSTPSCPPGTTRRCAATTSTSWAPAGTRRSPPRSPPGATWSTPCWASWSARVGAPTSAAVTTAVVDGAVVTALTEQRPVRATACALLVDAWGTLSRPYADEVPHNPADLHVWSLPLRTRFRGLTVRDGLLVRGAAGWGEFSPFWDYDDAESVAWWRAAREAADVGWPAPVRTRIPVNVTVPAVDAETAHRIVRESGGCRTAKVKVAEPGQSLADEIARLEAVRDALGTGGRIRVDANAAWDVDDGRRPARRARPGRRRARVRGAAGARASTTSRRCADARTCRSRPTSRSAGPTTPSRSPARTPPTSSCSRSSPSVACARAWSWRSGSGCRSWSRRPWSRRSGSRPGSRSRPPSRSCPTRAAWPPRSCSATTWWTHPFRPVDGALDVRRPDPDPDLLAAARRTRRAHRPVGRPARRRVEARA